MLAESRSLSGRERNNCLLNLREGCERSPEFADLSARSGFESADDARALEIVDWDHDDDLDVWVRNRTSPQLRYLQNQCPEPGRFLALRLEDVQCNRDAIGPPVELHLDEGAATPLIRTVRAGQGFLSQSSKWIHFGAGNAEKISRVVVHWPGGDSDSYDDLMLDQFYERCAYQLTPLRSAALSRGR